MFLHNGMKKVGNRRMFASQEMALRGAEGKTGHEKPHLYTRTRDFYRDFADALSQLDEVILTEIYPAREQPIPGVTSQLIYDNLKPGVEKAIIRKDDVIDYVKSRDFDVLIILGAGDLDNYTDEIAHIIDNK